MKRALPLLFAVVACQKAAPPAPFDTPPAPSTAEAPVLPPPEVATRFVDDAEARWHEQLAESDHAAWVNQTHITLDTDWLSARAAERDMALTTGLVQDAAKYKGVILPEPQARKLELLRVNTVLPAPPDPAERRELAEIVTDMTSMYGTAKYCKAGPKGEVCQTLDQLSKVLATDRNYDHQLEAWAGWHDAARAMRPKFQRFVELGNEGATSIGFKDLGELWRARFDMPPAELEAEIERLWTQVQPLYQAMHCYVRKKLSARYSEQKVPKTGPIPAHLLGNMWAQHWGNIYPIVEPYPGVAHLNVTAALKAKKYDAVKMMRTGEAFFTGLGFPSLPATFWERSMLTRPKDREVVCHASAWDIGETGDVRIKMCVEPTEEDLVTIHHELGHVYYYLSYGKQPALFQQGANEGFHEGIGDTLALSMTPQYLKSLGLIDNVPANSHAEIDTLMKLALERVAFLPFGKLVDQWRWQVFDGRTKPEQYNAAWWQLRQKYQGIAPPEARGEQDFDPGAKYHVPANTPYSRYFLAYILEFQFHRALCRASGHQGPLHTCSIAGSPAAGEKLAAMLRMGASKPWPDALEAIAGQRTMDASALIEYFAPLEEFLNEQNAGEQCGW